MSFDPNRMTITTVIHLDSMRIITVIHSNIMTVITEIPIEDET